MASDLAMSLKIYSLGHFECAVDSVGLPRQQLNSSSPRVSLAQCGSLLTTDSMCLLVMEQLSTKFCT